MRVRLERRGTVVATGVTDADGRLRDWVPASAWGEGVYRLVFDTGGFAAFFPEVVVVFEVIDPTQHHHVPLLLSEYSYTTYRGS
jgi:5-hydroxyisourate hydrolase